MYGAIVVVDLSVSVRFSLNMFEGKLRFEGMDPRECRCGR